MFDKSGSNKKRWRDYYQMDSGSESQALLSSDTSLRSKGSYGGPAVMFPDSETSDYETATPMRHSLSQQSLTSERSPQYSTRRPYHYRNDHRFKGGLEDLSSIPMTYNRFQYYNKLRTYAADEDGALILPDHVLPESFWVPYIPGTSHAGGKQSSVVTIFSIWNTILGSSLLSMPWGIQRAGLLGGMMLMILMGALCLYTTFLILKVHSHYAGQNEFIDVSELCKMLLGRYVEIIARVISLIVLLGAAVVYWVLMSNFFYNSVNYFHDSIYDSFPRIPGYPNSTGAEVLCPRYEETFAFNITTMAHTESNFSSEGNSPEHPWEKLPKLGDTPSFYDEIWSLHGSVPIFLAFIIFPLVNFRSATFFTKFNSLGTLSVIYLIIFVITKANKWGININLNLSSSPPVLFNQTNSSLETGHGMKQMIETATPLILSSFPALSGMLALSFFIHNIIINIMRNNQKQENNTRDLSIAFFLVTTTYLIIGIVFYACFPLNKICIEDAFLNNFPISDGMTVAARLFLFFQLTTVFPLLAYMLRIQLFSALPFLRPPTTFHHVTSFSKVSNASSSPPQARMLYIVCINLTLITICILFAIFLPRVGTIIRFTGAVSGFVYVFTIPCLLHIASQRLNSAEEGVFSTGMSATSLMLHMAIPSLAFANLVAQFFISDS